MNLVYRILSGFWGEDVTVVASADLPQIGEPRCGRGNSVVFPRLVVPCLPDNLRS